MRHGVRVFIGIFLAAVLFLLTPAVFLPSHISPNKSETASRLVTVTRAVLARRPSSSSKSVRKMSTGNADFNSTSLPPLPRRASDVIVFYYPWYGSLSVNGEWLHWNHQILVDNGIRFEPPLSIGANFYPELGPYSSTDPALVREHMSQIRRAGAGVLCISWWGQSNSDGQLTHLKGYTDKVTALILDAAQTAGLTVCFHHEPYEGRNPTTVREDIEYVISQYGRHPALHRHRGRPVFFVYDAYLTKADEWARLLKSDGDFSIRGSENDAFLIALYVDSKDKALILQGGFDGAYTYFAAEGFTQGSTANNWPALARWAAEHSIEFVPSVGPGYDDTRIRPWNSRNKRDRASGAYYDAHWQAAIATKPQLVSVTSFNEWHEGTQIEPAIPAEDTDVSPAFRYSDYMPREPAYYLERTRYWVDKFSQEPT